MIVQLIVGISALAIIAVVGYYWAMSMRQAKSEGMPLPKEMLAIFGEMYADGKLDNDEFNAVKRYLGEMIRRNETFNAARPGNVVDVLSMAKADNPQPQA